MRLFNFLKTNKVGILSMLLVVLAAVLGADSGFAMAVDPVELSDPANPSGNMEEYDASTNPEGRPADETLQVDEQGGKTQLQGKAATATDARDAGLEAEDYDRDVDEFRKFRFPSETYIARQCRPVKCNSYVHGHWRSGSTDLEAVFNGEAITITGGTTAGGYNSAKKTLTMDVSAFDNPECMKEYATVLVKGADGYRQENGKDIIDGTLVLYVLNHNDDSDKIVFRLVNGPTTAAAKTTISSNAVFYVMATAGTESQIRVASETYLPEKQEMFLQKKIVTCIITDEFEGQDKKVSHKTRQVLANAEYNFKRECARSHWEGAMGRIDVNVKETGNREAAYLEKGILRQIPMLYTHGEDLTDDDLLALTTLQFTNNSMSDEATAFCGKKAMARLIKLVNSADKYKDVGKVEVNDYGIKVRKYRDNFGSLEFVWDPTLDDIGKEEYMVIVDLRHADRLYKNGKGDKQTTRDMSKTGEAREAKEYNLCRIDCVALNGFNAIIAVPSTIALEARNIGGIEANFEKVAALPSGDALTAEAKAKKYYLTADDANAGFDKGDIVEWDVDLDTWVNFTGLVR